MNPPAIIHIDGASRGNPGPAAFAVVIAAPGRPVEEFAATLGDTTNNVAEYTALVKALEKARESRLKSLHIHSDSELLVKQMNGEYRVKHPDLIPLYNKARQLLAAFENVQITHVRREQNKRADELCNIALDVNKPKTAASGTTPSAPKVTVSDDAIREDAILALAAAAKAWGANGGTHPAPMIIWEQLWGLLADSGLLKTKKS